SSAVMSATVAALASVAGVCAATLPATSTPTTIASIDTRKLSGSIAIPMTRFITAPPLRNHSAVEHLVHNRARDLVEELLAHLRVVLQKAENALLLRTRRLAALLPQLLAGRALIFLNHFVDDHLEQWTLRISQAGCRKHGDDD